MLVTTAVSKIDRRMWAGDETKLLDEYRSFLTEPAVQSALFDALGRLELSTFQLRTLDLHSHMLTDGHFASTWKVESGDAKLFDTGDATRVSYHFDTSSSPPVVLRYDFDLPDGVTPHDLHKLTLAIKPDNSWHRVTATLDIGGNRWEAQQDNYIAQHRPTAFLFQPPTFEDELMRAQTWTSLKRVG